MQTLLLATRNRKKCGELQALLDEVGGTFQVLTVDDVPLPLPEVEEDGETFTDNARKKAMILAQASGLLTLADDSGLCVDALAGAPGVYSARFAGEDADDLSNNALLLEKMQGVDHRKAHFVCVLALATPDGDCHTVSGRCDGVLRREVSGQGGFGYDPLFVPDGYPCTFAEMHPAEKHRISHRGKALQTALRTWLVEGVFQFN